jgi:hypothetical protein
MKLKAVGLKFALGMLLLSFFLYIVLSFNNVFSDKSLSLISFQYSQFTSKENTALVILDKEATYLDRDEIIVGFISFEEGIIYFNFDGNELSFVALDEDTLFLTKELLYFERNIS